MPHRLQKIIEDRKNRPGTFAYKNSKYTYLVVCYGEKPYSGYSIRIEECWKDKEQLYLKTQLIGPSAGEEIIETRTCPFLVVRCERTEISRRKHILIAKTTSRAKYVRAQKSLCRVEDVL